MTGRITIQLYQLYQLWLSTNCQNFSDSRSMAPKSYISCRRLCRRKMRRLRGQKMLGEPWADSETETTFWLKKPGEAWEFQNWSSKARVLSDLSWYLDVISWKCESQGTGDWSNPFQGSPILPVVTTAGGHRNAINPKDQPYKGDMYSIL
jgi:hypothetical protein